MKTFALVRDADNLARACTELSALLAWRLRRHRALPSALILGIWIEPRMVAEVPARLTARDRPKAGQPGRIQSSVGLSGIWTLCWLDNDQTDRQSLLRGLAEATPDGIPSGGFVPVFAADAEESQVQSELGALRDCYPKVLSPLYQDRMTGQISSDRPCTPRSHGGASP